MTPRKVSWLLLAVGPIALLFSVIYESSILAFIGLGLTLWGSLLLYIRPEKYVKTTLLDPTASSLLANLDQMLTELRYKGKGIYLPPKYLKDFEKTKVLIPKNKYASLPTPKEIQDQEDKFFLRKPEAILIEPPGLALSRLFEKTLGTSFTKVDMKYLKENLPRLFIEDLEIADDLEIRLESEGGAKKTDNPHALSRVQAKYKGIQVSITNSVYASICREVGNLRNICGAVGCPISSAIACALAKATGSPVVIKNIQLSADGKTVEATFQLQETIESEESIAALLAEAIDVEVRRARARLLVNLAGFLTTVLGCAVLVWVGQITWQDMTVWSKDIVSIFFEARTGQKISLGIGMRVVHYFLAGLALVLSGLLLFLLRRRKRK